MGTAWQWHLRLTPAVTGTERTGTGVTRPLAMAPFRGQVRAVGPTHPRIVAVPDIVVTGNRPYLLMGLVAGRRRPDSLDRPPRPRHRPMAAPRGRHGGGLSVLPV
jgi:hypothetical protein